MSDTLDRPEGGARRLADISQSPDPVLGDKPINPDRYWSKEFAQKEWDKVWTKTWQIAGTAAELKKRGDYITTTLGHEVILCVRGDDDVNRAFYNVCQHRGMLLVDAEQGNTGRRIACPYHGWTYDLKGTLKVVPDEPDFIHGSPCGKANLVEIPCETWAGFVWYNMDPDCASLRSSMQPIADQIDTYPMDQMIRTHWVTVEGDWNWKLVQDNFDDSYHVPFVHPESKYGLEYAYDNSQFDLYQSGHARMLMPGAGPTKTLQGGEDETLRMLDRELRFWELDPDQFRGGKTREIRLALQQQKRLLGAKKGFDFSTYQDAQLTDHWHFTIFPNLSFSLKPDHNLWLRARPHETDPERCYFDSWVMTFVPPGETKYWSGGTGEWVDISVPAPHLVGQVGEVSCGPGIDQDVAVWRGTQRGLHSRGYKRELLAHQERRVRYFHQNLDRMIEG